MGAPRFEPDQEGPSVRRRRAPRAPPPPLLSREEVRDGLLLGAGLALAHALLPAGTIDPWGLLDPRRLLALVAIVVGVQAAGHLLVRRLRGRTGLVLAGVAAGFASSTAAIGGLGALARRDPARAADAAAAALASNLGTFVQMGILLASGAPALLRPLAPALAAAALVIAVVVARRLRAAPAALPAVSGRAFAPRQALVFVAAVVAVSLLALLARVAVGEAAVPAALAIAGLVDPHAAAATAMQWMHSTQLPTRVAADAIAWALVANLAAKWAVARATGGAAYAARLLPGLAACAAAVAAAAWLRA